MIRTLASALAAAALAVATPALAQSAPSIQTVSAWLSSKGGVVSPVQRESGETYFTVRDGALNWMVFFYGCHEDVCSDIQFSAVFSNPTVTVDTVNAWNREQRFLKAFYVPGQNGGDPSAAVQYDVLLRAGDAEQLADPASIWIGLVEQFATHVGYLRAEGETAPAPRQ